MTLRQAQDDRNAPLKLFNSLTRQLEEFQPVHEGEARVYSCGPTVYNYPHIGNMRAYVFADVLGRTLSFKGYKLTHVINITDVGHLTDDADAGEDKMEKMAAERAQSIWDIAKHYTEAYWADVKALNIRQPAHWSVATDYIDDMLEFAKSIADKHCYELDSGLYFDVSTVEDYGRLAGQHDLALRGGKILRSLLSRAQDGFSNQGDVQEFLKQIGELREFFEQHENLRTRGGDWQKVVGPLRDLEKKGSPSEDETLAALDEVNSALQELGGQGRIEAVEGKRNAADFAIWRKTPPGEKRQMEWDSPWGRGAPGWHLECSVMSGKLLGFPFDIHTGGIDHREIHHPNEIAQNQARCCTNGLDLAENSGARIWMHNNFLVERSGKMSKSAGEFLRLQLLIDKGYHPLAYRMMCLQAHYRSELEFSWENLTAALTRLKRMVMQVETLKARHAELGSASIDEPGPWEREGGWTLKQVQGDGELVRRNGPIINGFDVAISNDLLTPEALTDVELILSAKKQSPEIRLKTLAAMDSVLGLGLLHLNRSDLRIRPKSATITEEEIEDALARRKAARAEMDFATSDAIRDELAAKGVEVMDGDPLGWEWKL